jgi:hypothetical protein
MSQSQRTRIAPLESRVRRYLVERNLVERTERFDADDDVDDDGYLDSYTFNFFLPHAVDLAFLIRFGDP